VIFTWFDDASHSRFVGWVGKAVSVPVGLVDRLFARKPEATKTHDPEVPPQH